MRLLGIVTLGVVCIALTSALMSAWVTSKQARSQAIAQGRQITGSLAEQSKLALLYASQENAEKPLNAIMSFPGVDYAGIFDTGAQPLLVLGGRLLDLPKMSDLELFQEPLLVRETTSAWHFVASIHTGDSADSQGQGPSPFLTDRPVRELLGYAYVVMNKASLRDIQGSIFVNNILIGLAFALGLIFILNIAIKRLTRPLYQLSEIMNNSECLGTHAYAHLQGPREITHMAEVFNRMMARLEEQDRCLRQHGEMLQSEVAIRTRELVEARDAALTACRHKTEFLANMSHELRTPLQTIIGYSDLVKEELELEGMDQGAEELERVIHNAQRLLSLINNILGLAKMEAGRMELRIQAVNLRELITEAAQTVEPLLKLNSNMFEVEIRADQELLIDREKLLQSVLNLLSNASKFTRDGTVSLEAVHSADLLIIRVSDTGIGLAPEEQKIIFEEFRQADGSSTRKFQGTGLGLAITRRFCELMGGCIEVASEPGRGSVFTIQIPLPISHLGREAKEAVWDGEQQP